MMELYNILIENRALHYFVDFMHCPVSASIKTVFDVNILYSPYTYFIVSTLKYRVI